MKNATTATLTYDVLDHLVAWNAGSTNQEWYAYDASGNRVLRRSTTGSGTSITIYAFGLEEHLYGATGINTGNTFYYRLSGRLIGSLTGITTLTPQFFLTDALGSVPRRAVRRSRAIRSTNPMATSAYARKGAGGIEDVACNR